MRWWLWAALVVAGLCLVLLGLRRGEWTVVKRQADTLCTSCIGLTAN